jgi:hypothetical protein
MTMSLNSDDYTLIIMFVGYMLGYVGMFAMSYARKRFAQPNRAEGVKIVRQN